MQRRIHAGFERIEDLLTITVPGSAAKAADRVI
jgi:hypothetical protein